MNPGRVLLIALVTEGMLAAIAAWLSHVLNIRWQWGNVPRDVAIGTAAACVLAAGNYWMLMRAPSNWLVDGIRAVYHDILVPIFGGFPSSGTIVVGAAAGVGEELLFRGVLQPRAGLIIASVVFGLGHTGGRQMLPFGVWAGVMGLVLGTLASATGGLTAPVIAHGLYDILALQFLRRGAHTA